MKIINNLNFLRAHGVIPTSVICTKREKPCAYRQARKQWFCNNCKKIANTTKRRRCDFGTSDYKGNPYTRF